MFCLAKNNHPVIIKILKHKTYNSVDSESFCFSCEFRSNINDSDLFTEWLRTFETITKTNWIFRSSVSADKSIYAVSRDYICRESLYRRKKTNKQNDKSCKATLKIRIKNNTKFIRCRDSHVKEGLYAVIHLNFTHSHAVNGIEAWDWLRKQNEARESFIGYFNCGVIPSNVLKYHEAKLSSDGEEDTLTDVFENPPEKWVHYLYKMWFVLKDIKGKKDESVKVAVPLPKEKDDSTPEVSQDISENLPLSVDIKEEPDSVSISLSSSTDAATEPGCSNWNTDNASKQPTDNANKQSSSNISNSVKNEQPSSTVPPKPPVADKICRLCMSVDGLFGIYDRVSVLRDLSSKIVEVCAIPIYEEDGLPQLICKKCFLSIQNFYDFKVQCAVTDVTLKAELGKELLGSFGKRRGQITEFQKLNMRMKANLQSFYDLVDAINELQDKVELTLSSMSGTTQSLTKPKPKCKDVVQSTGRKRKADEAVSESARSPSSTLDKPLENNSPDTSTCHSTTTDSVSSSDLITNSVLNIKTEPEPDPDDEPEPDLGTLFVSNIDGSLLKVEVDEELESESVAHTDYSEPFIPEEQQDEQMEVNEQNDNINSYDNG